MSKIAHKIKYLSSETLTILAHGMSRETFQLVHDDLHRKLKVDVENSLEWNVPSSKEKREVFLNAFDWLIDHVEDSDFIIKNASRIADEYDSSRFLYADHDAFIQWTYISAILGDVKSADYLSKYILDYLIEDFSVHSGVVPCGEEYQFYVALQIWYQELHHINQHKLSKPTPFKPSIPDDDWLMDVIEEDDAAAEPADTISFTKQFIAKQYNSVQARNRRVNLEDNSPLDFLTFSTSHYTDEIHQHDMNALRAEHELELKEKTATPKTTKSFSVFIDEKLEKPRGSGSDWGMYEKLHKEGASLRVSRFLDSRFEELREEFPNFHEVIDLIEKDQRLGKSMGKAHFHFKPILLHGVPGTGKTKFMYRLGELFQMPTTVFPCAGSSDDRLFRGTGKGWGNATPGYPLSFIAQKKVANPLICMDEVDKIGSDSHGGNLADSMLTALEPTSARQYFDECFATYVDLRWISWLGTANNISAVSAPLLSRMRHVEIKPLKDINFTKIVQSLVLDVARTYEAPCDLVLPDASELGIDMLEAKYRKYPDMRELRRLVEDAIILWFSNQENADEGKIKMMDI